MVFNMTGAAGSAFDFPRFTYSGTYSFVDDGEGNWRIKLLTSGTLTFTGTPDYIDVFLVGGGGGSAGSSAGAAGGYTRTETFLPARNTEYPIVIGAGGVPNSNPGGTSSAFGYEVNGGGGSNGSRAGSGGSGGGAWYAGAGGSNGASAGGIGQGTTTREFGEASGDLYAGGGGSGGSTAGNGGAGGAGGGGDGYPTSRAVYNGAVNTGGGAGGGRSQSSTGYTGGSGIVIIRNHRAA